jgi:hypothetical protein
MDMIDLGVIGAGGIAQTHLYTLQKVAGSSCGNC